MATQGMTLIDVHFENIRGFYDAYFPLENEKILIVGRNHAGKTSAFLLLKWLINEADPTRLLQADYLSDEEKHTLLPARTTPHRARRITLKLRIPDRRRARRLRCDDNNYALLRVGIRVSGPPYAFIQLGPAKRDSGEKSEKAAADLLKEVQEIFSVVHIPSARDASSTQFRARFRGLFRNKLAERALHPGKQAGSTAEYRKVVATTDSLRALAHTLVDPLLEQLATSLPPGLLERPFLSFEGKMEEEVVNWLTDQISMNLVTGDHDDSGVAPIDVGAGLQSVLDIAAASVMLGDKTKKLIIAVEEPESFLHPSLQRVIARKLLSAPYGHKTFISTHSPILVEEARYDHILIAANQSFQRPSEENDIRREEIHTALLNGYGAEMIFASSILLVEGEGDRAFFEGLRRKLAAKDESGRIEHLFIVPVGGKNNFGPWIKLIRSLNRKSSDPFSFLVAPDGDATREVQEAFNQCDISIPLKAYEYLQKAPKQFGDGEFSEWRQSLLEANDELAKVEPSFPLCFLEGDLEYAILSSASDYRCRQWAELFGVKKYENKTTFIKKFGSKAVDGKGGSQFKAPYMRKVISEQIPENQLSYNVKTILKGWLRDVMPQNEINLLIDNP